MADTLIINGETITREMVRRVDYSRESVETTPTSWGASLSYIRTFEPVPVWKITLYLHDGRTLTTEDHRR